MGKIVLFSPVGGTDPMSADNDHDGSLIHIARHKRPDLIYLYMSAEMLEIEERDHRVTEAIGLLGKHLNHHFDFKIIARPEMRNVHRFDPFYQDLREVLREISSGLSGDDRLLVNVSSGTPAMKSALIVMAGLGDYEGECYQVAAPGRKMGVHSHPQEFELQLRWECNEDNLPGAEDRTELVSMPNLMLIRTEQAIKEFVLAFDYGAALRLARDLGGKSPAYLPYLELAACRAELDLRRVGTLERELGESFCPVQGADVRQVFEYALATDLRRRRGQFADFIRALSPMIVDLFELVLDDQLGHKVSDLYELRHGEFHWKQRIFEKPDGAFEERVGSLLDEAYDWNFNRHDIVKSDHLCRLIAKCADAGVVHDVQLLRDVESKVRNVVAHEIVNVSDDFIRERTGGLGSRQIMDLVRKVMGSTRIHPRRDYWDSYDTLNQRILEKMKEGSRGAKAG